MDTQHFITEAAFPDDSNLPSLDACQIQNEEDTDLELVIKARNAFQDAVNERHTNLWCSIHNQLRDELFRLARELVTRGPKSTEVAIIYRGVFYCTYQR